MLSQPPSKECLLMMNKDFQDILRAFKAHKVKCLAVGSYASVFMPDRPTLLRPIFDDQALYARQLRGVCSNQNEIPAESLSGNQRVVFTDALTLAF
jgi:hypothetical protein